jgi:2-oxoglutarate dehydrogenase E2 component (dihydrolipoamide succinyltransferase)
MIDIKVPTIGESITEVTLLKWTKKEGEWVERDEVIAELESEKATFEVNAEKAGILTPQAKEGDTLHIGDVLAKIDETAAKPEGGTKDEVQSTKPAACKTGNRKGETGS